MERNITIKLPPKINHIDQFTYQADGTLYDITVIDYTGTFYAPTTTGIVPNGILIIAGNRKAYCFHKHSYISQDYIHEKLCPNWSQTDAKNIREALLKRGWIK